MKKRLIIFISLILLSSLLIGYISFYFNSSDNGTREKTIIQYLLSKGYTFVLPKDYFVNPNKFNKTVLLIHDIDFTVGGWRTFIKIENDLGIKSAFYPRYIFFQSSDYKVLRTIQSEGFEIGFQYECLSETDNDLTKATLLFKNQMILVNTYSIRTTDYHGDSSKLNIFNLNLYNEILWKNYGLNEVYKLQNYSYYSDSNNRLVSPQEPLKSLVIVQLHTDWTR